MAAVALAVGLAAFASASADAGVGVVSSSAKVHFACSKPNSAKIPCYFHTPDNSIRCVWTPHSLDVVCVKVATRRGFVLHPKGKAGAVKVNLMHAGELLPTSQQIVFPKSLSCHDSKSSITCNQDEGTGAFEISAKGSHSS
ncbi:MAG TPA: hypothetical protein VGG08_04315 [Solirubrobacteraceae bacterium]